MYYKTTVGISAGSTVTKSGVGLRGSYPLLASRIFRGLGAPERASFHQKMGSGAVQLRDIPPIVSLPPLGIITCQVTLVPVGVMIEPLKLSISRRSFKNIGAAPKVQGWRESTVGFGEGRTSLIDELLVDSRIVPQTWARKLFYQSNSENGCILSTVHKQNVVHEHIWGIFRVRSTVGRLGGTHVLRAEMALASQGLSVSGPNLDIQ